MISAASSQRAVLLCLLQSLAGVIFGWSNAEGSGLVSHHSGAHMVRLAGKSADERSSKWRPTRGDSENVMPLEHALSARPGRVPSLVF